MEVWKVIFLSSMGDGCRFQPLIFQGVGFQIFLGVTFQLGKFSSTIPKPELWLIESTLEKNIPKLNHIFVATSSVWSLTRICPDFSEK